MFRSPFITVVPACIWAVIVVTCLIASASAQNLVAKYSRSHFAPYGVRLPSREFMEAMRSAAINISHVPNHSTLVILCMANEHAMERTVPHFLESLSQVHIISGNQTGQALDGHLVLVAWSVQALTACQELQTKYEHKCVRDAEHTATQGAFGFHDTSFNSLGFAKIKYILNGLSAGHDVVFLDADIVVLRNPLPYMLSSGADMLGAMEKCLVFPDSLVFGSKAFRALNLTPPPLNIGVLYFRATAAVTRCVYNWIWDMKTEARSRPKVWDQDLYNKIMFRCSVQHGLRLQALDPRLFQSGCFPGCGCVFPDGGAKIRRERIGTFSKGRKSLPGGICGPRHWKRWLLRHFPCSGLTEEKGALMEKLVRGFHANKPAAIIKLKEGKI